MKKITIVMVFFCMAGLSAKAQTFQWAKQIGGANDDQVNATTIDVNQNIITTGSFKGDVDFDPGAGTFNFPFNGDTTATKMFIQKLDANGNFLWAKQLVRTATSSADFKGVSVTTDASGNIYVLANAAGLYDSVDTDPGPGVHWIYENTDSCSISTYTFLEKLDANGNFVWEKHFSCIPIPIPLFSINLPVYLTRSHSVIVDASGNIFVVGEFRNKFDFNPSPTASFIMESPKTNSESGFIVKLNSSGNFVWAKKLGQNITNTCDVAITAFSIDGAGNIYTKGGFSGNADFDPGSTDYFLNATTGLLPAVTDSCQFLCKLDNNGNFVWAKKYIGMLYNCKFDASSLVIDAAGNVYSCAYSNILTKYSASGNIIWNTVTNTINWPGGVAMGSNGKIYLAGNGVSQKINVSQYDTSGVLNWTNGIACSVIPFTSFPSVTIDNSGNILFVGSYKSAATVGSGTGSFVLPNNGGSDFFIAKLNTMAEEVWPGDADNNTIVNNSDLLPIGLLYGQLGITRSVAGNVWQADTCANWGVNEPNGVDIKHADCNGDGIIDANDTLAVNLNFSSAHAMIPNQINNSARVVSPDIYFVTGSGTYTAGDIVDVEVWLGNATTPVNNLYGIAFDINYTASLVQSSTENITYPASWLGIPGTDAIKLSKIDANAITAYGVETRITHTNASGFGKIADFRFQAKTTLSTVSTFNLSVSNYTANDATGQPIIFNSIPYSVIINPVSVGIQENENQSTINISPNPATGNITITSSSKIKEIKLMNVIGETILQSIVANQQPTIDISQLTKGIYFVQAQTEKGIVNKKIVKQ